MCWSLVSLSGDMSEEFPESTVGGVMNQGRYRVSFRDVTSVVWQCGQSRCHPTTFLNLDHPDLAPLDSLFHLADQGSFQQAFPCFCQIPQHCKHQRSLYHWPCYCPWHRRPSDLRIQECKARLGSDDDDSSNEEALWCSSQPHLTRWRFDQPFCQQSHCSDLASWCHVTWVNHQDVSGVKLSHPCWCSRLSPSFSPEEEEEESRIFMMLDFKSSYVMVGTGVSAVGGVM